MNDNKLNALALTIIEINRGNGWDVADIHDWMISELSEPIDGVISPKPNVDKLMRLLALVHSEVSEAVEAVRKNDKDNFVEELADILIRVLDISGGLELDIGKAVAKKLEHNKNRGYRHGGKLA